MQITYAHERARYEARIGADDFDARKALRAAGWRYAAYPVGRWWHDDPERVRPWERHCDLPARLQLDLNPFEAAAALEHSRAPDLDITLPVPAGLAYMPFQRAGIAYALPRPTCLIADEMGLGKTIQAIGLVNADPTIARVLIICPASLRLNWQREWQRWSTRPIVPLVVRPGGAWPLDDGLFSRRRAMTALIISYHMVAKWKAELVEYQPDILIADECHSMKSTKAQMTRAVLGFQRPGHKDHVAPIRARRTLFLSGTPLLNRPEELWTAVRKLDPKGLGQNKHEFWERYVLDKRNHEELNTLLRSRIMIRRQKQDVLKELPPKRRQLVPLEVDGAREALGEERRILEQERKRLEALRQNAAAAKGSDGYRAAAFLLQQGRMSAMEEINAARLKSARLKLPVAIEHMREILATGQKLLAFHHHHEIGDGLRDAFNGEAVAIDGRTPANQRMMLVDQFMKLDSKRVFIGSIRAAGQGLTLTAASTVVFLELDWTPAWMSQAEDRAHRIGQRDSVLVQHLVLDGSIDALMAKTLVEKQAMLDQVLGDRPPSEDQLGQSVLDEVLAA